jgi:hypothetical protein
MNGVLWIGKNFWKCLWSRGTEENINASVRKAGVPQRFRSGTFHTMPEHSHYIILFVLLTVQ